MGILIRVRDRDSSWQVDVSGAAVKVDGRMVELRDLTDGRWQVVADGAAPVTGCAAAEGDSVWVWLDGNLFELQVETAGAAASTRPRGREGLSAPMPATVVRIAVQAGDLVSRGQTLVVLEAMKMELPIRAPQDGTVTAVHCREGDLVQPGVVLVDVT